MCGFTGWTFDYVYSSLTWPRYQSLTKFWNEWPPLAVSSARAIGAGPKPEAQANKSRKLIPTGDPNMPFAYEATAEEMEGLAQFFGGLPKPKEE